MTNPIRAGLQILEQAHIAGNYRKLGGDEAVPLRDFDAHRRGPADAASAGGSRRPAGLKPAHALGAKKTVVLGLAAFAGGAALAGGLAGGILGTSNRKLVAANAELKGNLSEISTLIAAMDAISVRQDDSIATLCQSSDIISNNVPTALKELVNITVSSSTNGGTSKYDAATLEAEIQAALYQADGLAASVCSPDIGADTARTDRT